MLKYLLRRPRSIGNVGGLRLVGKGPLRRSEGSGGERTTPACSSRAGSAPGASRSEMQWPEHDLAFLGGDRGGRGRFGGVRPSRLKGRWLWVAGASRNLVG